MYFPVVGNKRKHIYIMKNEKKKLVQNWFGLLPNCIAREGVFVLQYKVYCKLTRDVEWLELYCNREVSC